MTKLYIYSYIIIITVNYSVIMYFKWIIFVCWYKTYL